jgi:hypothetical protein
VHDDRVDDGGDADAVHEVALELRAFGHRARHDRGGGGGERHLEEERHTDGQVPDLERAIAQEPAVVADEVVAGAERKGVADREEGDRAGAEVHQVLHHDVGHALGPGESGLDQGEAGLHEDHQDRADQHEHVVEVHLHGVRRELLRSGRPRPRHQRCAGHTKAGSNLQLPHIISSVSIVVHGLRSGPMGRGGPRPGHMRCEVLNIGPPDADESCRPDFPAHLCGDIRSSLLR